MFQYSSINPAAAGEGDMIRASLLHRLNWIGIRNGGSTTLASVDGLMKSSGVSKHALGLKLKNDESGLYYFQHGHLQYAYKRKIMQGVLSGGIGLGYVNVGFKGDSVNLKNVPLGSYHVNDDLFIPSTNVNGSNFDVNIGVWYTAPSFYVGVSYMNLTQPDLYWTETQDYKLKSTLYLAGGYKYSLANPKYVLKPSMLVKTDFVSTQIDFSTYLEYNEKYWGGLSYRFQDAIVVLAGLTIPGGINLGYSFDLPISQRGGWGSHELCLVYEFDLMLGKHKNKYKSIRIL